MLAGATLTLIGLGALGAGFQDVGTAITLPAVAAFALGIHRFGRLGARVSPRGDSWDAQDQN